jgi:hypothetical protein
VDVLTGAVAMLALLVVGAAVLWWTVSDPAGRSGSAGSGSAESGRGGAVERPGDRPPADLARDEVWLSDLELDAGAVVAAGSRLRDVRAVGQDVVTGPRGLVAARVDLEATVPFEVVAAELGGDSVVRPAEDGQAMVVRTVELVGRELRVVATGTVEVEDGRLVVEPSRIDIGGPDFLGDAIAAVVRGLVTIEHDIEGLPEGLMLQDVTVRRDGFRAGLVGQDVRLLP